MWHTYVVKSIILPGFFWQCGNNWDGLPDRICYQGCVYLIHYKAIFHGESYWVDASLTSKFDVGGQILTEILKQSIKWLMSDIKYLTSDVNIWHLLSIFDNYKHNIAITNEHFDSKSQYLMPAVKIFEVCGVK